MAILIPDALLRPSLTRLCLAATSPWNRQSSNEIKSLYRVAALGNCQMGEAVVDADKFRAEFLRVLRSRRSPEVPLNVKRTMPIQEPNPPAFSKVDAALISSWKRGDTMPFIFDTVWDLIKLADYLTKREDIDPCRIGITGESLGGMHAWFAAAADTRYSVVVPIIGVQCFRWAIDNDKWQARVEKARIELGMNEINKEVVKKVCCFKFLV
ncbi:hypothetical protein SDJN02_13441, partial [Cucurbita argyrosperma subsp. argyrosperma]